MTQHIDLYHEVTFIVIELHPKQEDRPKHAVKTHSDFQHTALTVSWHSSTVSSQYILVMWSLNYTWFQASAEILMRSSLFCDVTQWDNLSAHLQGPSIPKRRTWTAWPLKIGQIGCPETSVHNNKSTLRNIAEERRSQILNCLLRTINVTQQTLQTKIQ